MRTISMCVLASLLLCSCASSTDPEYAKRVAQFGKPDLVSDQSSMTPRYYSPELAKGQPPRTTEVYYYLEKDRQISFRRGMKPVINPIPPTMKEFIARLANQAK